MSEQTATPHLSAPVEFQETHTLDPFDLSKPLCGFGSSDPFTKHWWEPKVIFNLRKRFQQKQSQYREELNLEQTETIREMYKRNNKSA